MELYDFFLYNMISFIILHKKVKIKIWKKSSLRNILHFILIWNMKYLINYIFF